MNVFSLSHIIQEYIQEVSEYHEELLAYLSPYVTAHINRFGEYRIDTDRTSSTLPIDLSLVKRAAS
nr:transposase [Shimazuella soli]